MTTTGTWLTHGLLVAALAGTAAGSEVPPDIAAWFDQQAAATVQEISRDLVVLDEAPPQYRTLEVGRPRALHAWSADFRAGDATAAPTEPVGEWAAPYLGDGAPAGMVVAWHEDGAAALAYVDDAAELAAAVAKLPDDALLVQAPELGAHYAIVAGTVHTLHATRYGKTGATVPLATFQEQLAAWFADVAGPVHTPADASPSAALMVGALAGGALLLTGLLLAVRVRRRTRLSPGHRGDRGSEP